MNNYLFKKSMLALLVTTMVVVNLAGCSGSINVTYKHNPENIIVYDETETEATNEQESVENQEAQEVFSEATEEVDVLSDDSRERVDLIFFMGQSNMCGYGGDASATPNVEEEAGMEFRVISDPTKLYPLEEPFGFYENNENGLRDDTTAGRKSGSLVSSFINRYHDETGNKVVAVSASVGGMAMDLWLIPKFWDDCTNRIKDSIEWLNNNGYEAEHIYMVWFQGESDIARQVPVEEYQDNFVKFMDSLLCSGVQQIFLIVPNRTGTVGDAICDFQEKICEESNMYTVGSLLPSDFDKSGYAWDGIHFNQDSLNAIGEDAGENVGKYTIEIDGKLVP